MKGKKGFLYKFYYVTRTVVNQSTLFLKHRCMVHRRFERPVKSLDSCVANVTAMFFLQALPSVGQYQFVFARLAGRVSGWSDRLET